MVLNTQLQLKWPNHSSHLLTGLKSLFKNEQLVDCTLKCNKHSLKVHRSVLAACSPYFERELENNPSIVVEDVQFNVLQALIEFMYYGETRISEDNLTSLIEAAKLFEVKGLSEMDLLASNENSIILSVVAMNGNGGNRVAVKSASDQPAQLNPSYKNAQQSLPSTISSEDSEDSNSNLISEPKDSTQQHTCRNFVVTPPQTESAQILLSLARSYSEKHQPQQQITTIGTDGRCNVTTVFGEKQQPPQQIATIQPDTSCNVLPGAVYKEQIFVIDDAPLVNGVNAKINEQFCNGTNSVNGGEADLYVKYNGNSDTQAADHDKSLLAKLLTRNPTTTQTPPKNLTYYENYKTLYECETSSSATKNQNEANTSKTTTFALQSDVLEYPFLVHTNEGLVDVDMLNVFDNGEVFDPDSGSRAAIKFVPKGSVLATLSGGEISDCTHTKVKSFVDSHELQCIKQSAEDELKDDPEAVVMCKVNEQGQVEKYVLSSNDISALKEMNEQLKLERTQQQHTFNNVETPHIEVELPTSGNKSLITRIFTAGDKVENAISKLPFKKRNNAGAIRKSTNNVESVNTNSSSSSSSERLLNDTSLSVDAHVHHENMFEELDNQFSMECSIENIHREYGEYEEASKNETQLEHNYYANAMKDEDEECAVVISGDDFMFIEQPTDDDLSLVALSNNNNKRKSNANTSPTTSSSSLATFQIFTTDNVYLNGNERTPRRNGVVDKPIFNGKCDLILNTDELMNSVLTTVMNHTSSTASTKTRATNCALNADVNSLRNAKTKRRNSVNDVIADGALTLPFKKVKNMTAVEKKPRRTCNRRRSTSLNEDKKRNEDHSMNGGLSLHSVSNNNLVEEVIVDEVL